MQCWKSDAGCCNIQGSRARQEFCLRRPQDKQVRLLVPLLQRLSNLGQLSKQLLVCKVVTVHIEYSAIHLSTPAVNLMTKPCLQAMTSERLQGCRPERWLVASRCPVWSSAQAAACACIWSLLHHHCHHMSFSRHG